MHFIRTIVSISHQETFRVDNICDQLESLTSETTLESPNYNEFIPPASLRRLSPVLRMGLAASTECQNIVGAEFDAISVGTALGCLRDTEKFLVTFQTGTSDFLSPTAFIQSTHNTIGGQISLGLKNRAYNMTHTQNSLSFEVALIDAIMCVNEGKENVLVGAAEEQISFLELMQPNLISNKYPLSSGATFMALSPKVQEIGIRQVMVQFECEDINKEINGFLTQLGLSAKDLDMVLFSDTLPQSLTEGKKQLNYLNFSGMHFSASAFAVHIAHDYLRSNNEKRALVVNTICESRLGITLVEKA